MVVMVVFGSNTSQACRIAAVAGAVGGAAAAGAAASRTTEASGIATTRPAGTAIPTEVTAIFVTGRLGLCGRHKQHQSDQRGDERNNDHFYGAVTPQAESPRVSQYPPPSLRERATLADLSGAVGEAEAAHDDCRPAAVEGMAQPPVVSSLDRSEHMLAYAGVLRTTTGAPETSARRRPWLLPTARLVLAGAVRVVVLSVAGVALGMEVPRVACLVRPANGESRRCRDRKREDGEDGGCDLASACHVVSPLLCSTSSLPARVPSAGCRRPAGRGAGCHRGSSSSRRGCSRSSPSGSSS
jgi:hypothetical protein